MIGQGSPTQPHIRTERSFIFQAKIGSCTGWMIGPKTVATAGHCIYDTSSGSFAGTATVSPGRNGTSYPYGSVKSTRYFIPSGWRSGNTNYDYGAIELSEPIGNTVGYFGYSYTTSSLVGTTVTISGYPGDKTAGTQWQRFRTDCHLRNV